MALGLGLGINFNGSSGVLDPATTAFAAASGATDLNGINNLVVYLKAQNLWNNTRFFPFKSAQNAGTGTTVYGLGGWHSNNVTLINGPTWGANGVTFDGVDDYGTVVMTGFKSLTALTRFSRSAPQLASSPDTSRSSSETFGRVGTTNKFWLIGLSTSLTSGETATMGITEGANSVRIGTSLLTWAANEDFSFVNTITPGQQTTFLKNKTLLSNNATGTTGTGNLLQSAPVYSTYLTDDILVLSAISLTALGDSSWINERRICLLYTNVAVSDGQRETITDLINAL